MRGKGPGTLQKLWADLEGCACFWRSTTPSYESQRWRTIDVESLIGVTMFYLRVLCEAHFKVLYMYS